VQRGAIVPLAAHALWALWASSDSAQRVAAEPPVAADQAPKSCGKPSNSIFNLFS